MNDEMRAFVNQCGEEITERFRVAVAWPTGRHPFCRKGRMARDQVDMTPIQTREELVAWLEAGSKPKPQFRIGTEHEKFAFTVEGHKPVPYAGRRSIRALLEGMQHLLGWEP